MSKHSIYKYISKFLFCVFEILTLPLNMQMVTHVIGQSKKGGKEEIND